MVNCSICNKKVSYWSSPCEDDKYYCNDCLKNRLPKLKAEKEKIEKEKSKRIEIPAKEVLKEMNWFLITISSLSLAFWFSGFEIPFLDRDFRLFLLDFSLFFIGGFIGDYIVRKAKMEKRKF